MRAFCFKCQADTIIGKHGRCGFCDALIMTTRQRSQTKHVGGHSYIGTEEFYEAAYARYLELRSVRKVAGEVWESAGYSNQWSCAQSLYEVFAVRGWATYQRSYTRTKHGLLRRDYRDAQLRREQRLARGEIRGVKCAGIRADGEACSRPALRDGSYCHSHEPSRREQVTNTCARMRAKRGQDA